MANRRQITRPWVASIGLLFGGCALLIVLFHFGAGPLDPQPTIGQTIGETAADIRQSAVRALKGEPQPEPEAQPWSLDRLLKTLGPILGGAAILLGTLAYVLREDRRLAASAIGIGAFAIGFQLFTWTILMVAGVILLFGIMYNLGSILGE
ncbi:MULTISPECIES: hypothetical protein [Stappiaceae]|uniref:hypothetical protein n=1 Tax=Stappiaceae TaxID=2821832 RepID=UPI001ADCE165|nr:hypothetical protein [Labrenzia sp. R4_1]MBO9423542.1 hypothetical protein [Labrenzia sp. R4_1]